MRSHAPACEFTVSTSSPPSDSIPEGLVLRAVQAADVADLARLMELPAVRYGTLRLPFQSEKTVADKFAKPMVGASIVAVLAGQIVGHAELTRHPGRRSHAGSVAVAVHDAWHGHGIGRTLMQALLDTADRWLGLRRLELEVFADNLAAIALYRKLGFVEEGCLRAYAIRDGLLCDVLTMARIVEPMPRISAQS